MYKFFVEDNQINENRVTIIGEDVNHIKNVLRLEVEEEICICNKETSISFLCKIIELSNDLVICEIVEEIKDTTESNTYIHIFQGLPKSDKLEFIIEKCTEIGVKEITPVIMKRSIVKLEEKDKVKKLNRWQKIAEVAAKQSKRDKIPTVHCVVNLKNIYEKIEKYDIVIVAYEEESQTSIKQVLKTLEKNKQKNIAILVGPEGGISKEEIEFLKTLPNTKTVTLGKRILRTETAPLVLASVIMYEFNEMG